MFKTSLSLVLVCGLLPAQTASNQAGSTAAGESTPRQNVVFATGGLAMPGAGGGQISVVAHEFSFNSGKPVTGAPYSADQVTEHVQTLADGNRIVNTTTTKIYRDSQGRTRTETSLPTVAGGPAAPTMITIHDSVAGVTYLLNPDNKTAQKIAVAVKGGENPNVKGLSPLPPLDAISGDGPVVFATTTGIPKSDVKTEALGNQTIAGVAATGTRTTETIPAGAIGNEQAIETTSERWFSSALQIVVKSVHVDPRIGQTTETLNNLSRSEPDSSLFQVPSDYTVTDSKGPGVNVLVKQQQ